MAKQICCVQFMKMVNFSVRYFKYTSMDNIHFLKDKYYMFDLKYHCS